jgi:hypothetical protein
MALLAHYLTVEPMPWWPDTFVFGGFMGALAAFVVMRVRHFRHAAAPLRGVWRGLMGKRS